MSNYIGYKEEDNIKRKKNNITENHYESQVNQRTKRYTTYGSALSDHISKENAKKYTSEVRHFTQEEIDAINNKRSA